MNYKNLCVLDKPWVSLSGKIEYDVIKKMEKGAGMF
jgi:hypothetical protein